MIIKTITIKEFRKILLASVAVMLIVVIGMVELQPMIMNAATATDSVVVTLNVDAGISLTSPADTTMSTNLGVSTNSAIATTTWNVKTNNNLGYSLTVSASTNPAMRVSGTQFIDDFTPAGGTPALWSTLPTGHSMFGYSAYGTDVSTGTYGTGASCSAATSTPSTTLLYRGFTTSASPTIATRAATTTTSGVDTTICYAVEQKGVYIGSGVYTATITATATTL